ncbi:protein LAZ1, partial [Tanacetum coccineum]
DVFDKVKFLRTELGRVQECLDRDPSNASLREEEMVYASAFKDAPLDKEKLLQQKTKITWLKDGDFNSSYFHKVVKGRVSRNRIKVVYDDKGNPCPRDEIANIFVSHFMSFLGTQDDVYEVEDAESLFTNRLHDDVALDLIKPVHDKEIKEALFNIDDNKASGPDGYSSKFFKAAWSIVGQDLCSAVKEFFAKGKLLSEFNTTLISLVLKVKSPARVIDYKPISCCNVVYKVISKVITNRLKLVLNDLVDVNQSAFIPGRQSSDNILLAQEFMRNYGGGNITRNYAFKVDILKAYDTVNWSFLEFCLRSFGFHPTMINWIMICLTNASFSLCINGETHGFFKAKRGLRQGDPISPYLGLNEFSLSCGLYPSMSKSEAFFCGLTPVIKNDILMVMPFKDGALPIRYLGVPLVSKKINVNDCKVLIEVIQNRIKD